MRIQLYTDVTELKYFRYSILGMSTQRNIHREINVNVYIYQFLELGVRYRCLRTDMLISNDSHWQILGAQLLLLVQRTLQYTYISEGETSTPSIVQVTCGVGVPAAMHLSVTSGPGFNK